MHALLLINQLQYNYLCCFLSSSMHDHKQFRNQLENVDVFQSGKGYKDVLKIGDYVCVEILNAFL